MKTVQICLNEEIATGPDPSKLSRPFELHRTGSVLGEGAAVLILEELASAQARSAKIFGEIVGFGSSTVTNSRGTADLKTAISNALTQSMQRSDWQPTKVGHINAHGLGTQISDRQESQAIAQVFASRSQSIPVVAPKSYFGNLGAASGMVETICSLQALATGKLPATLNYETPDPDCPIALTNNSETPAGSNFISVNVSPQGQATSIAIQSFA
jgi:3-oxoacyl-[acyl-carrier-protein] synthase II